MSKASRRMDAGKMVEASFAENTKDTAIHEK
jgi:hypothetical protein